MQEQQHVDPDWQNEPYYKNRYPDVFEANPINQVLYSSMWKVQDADYSVWQDAASSADENVRNQRTHPVLDYGAPNLLYASWSETASMDPTHNGSQAGVSDEWQSMQEVWSYPLSCCCFLSLQISACLSCKVMLGNDRYVSQVCIHQHGCRLLKMTETSRLWLMVVSMQSATVSQLLIQHCHVQHLQWHPTCGI